MAEKVLFLDIDGVLQPGGSQKRFKHINEIESLHKELFDRHGVDYSVYFSYDVAAVYYDWDKESLRELKRILDSTGAKIVISSDWRVRKTLVCLQDFFRIHNLADYVTDFTPSFFPDEYQKLRETDEYKEIYQPRCVEILEYLKAHPEIKKWVALDDLRLNEFFTDNAVITFQKLVRADADKCIDILGRDLPAGCENLTVEKGRLYLVPTPLSELDEDSQEDFYVQTKILKAICNIKYFVVEDLRTARRYISFFKMKTPIDELVFSLLNEHTNITTVSSMLDPVFQGYDIALLSDAGMPCIADPGEELVRTAHSNDVTVIPLVGPSSIFLALAASGLSGEKFSFEGYLPAKTPDLIKAIKKLEHQSRQENQSKIFIETPYRSAKMFETILNVCSPDTLLCVACNITAADEFIRTRQIREWKKNIPEINKKPCIFILQA